MCFRAINTTLHLDVTSLCWKWNVLYHTLRTIKNADTKKKTKYHATHRVELIIWNRHHLFRATAMSSTFCVERGFRGWWNDVYWPLLSVYLAWTEKDGNYPAQSMGHPEINNTAMQEPSSKFQLFRDFSYAIATWWEPWISSCLIIKWLRKQAQAHSNAF